MATLAELVVKITGDTASLTAALGRAEKSSSSFGSKFGSIMKVGGLAAAAGIGAAAYALKGFVGDAMEAQKIQTQTNAVLESTKGISGMTAKSVEDLANSLSKVIPVDDELIQQTENMLLTFTRVGKDIFPQATEAALNMATALGGDPVDAAMKLGKALNDPIAGVTALRKVGVMLTDQQKDQIAAMMKAGDVAGAQAVILKELETEFGNSGRAAGQTAAGQFAIFNTQVGNIKESIGAALIPVLTKLAGYMTNTVIPAVQKFADEWGPKLRDAFVQAKDAINPVIDVMGKFFGLFEKKDLGLIFAAIAASIVAGFVAIAVAAGIAFIAENAALLGIPIAVAAAIAALTLLVTHWDAVWAGLQRAPAALLNWLKTSWQDALLIIAGPAGWLALLIKNWGSVWDAMPTPVKRALDRVGDFVEMTANGIIGAFEWAVNQSIRAFNWFAEKASGALSKVSFGKADLNLTIPELTLGRVSGVMEAGWLGSGAEEARQTFFDVEHGIKKTKDAVKDLMPSIGDLNLDLGGTGGAVKKVTDTLTEAEKGLISLLNYFNESGLSVEQYTLFLNMAQEAMTHFNLTGEQLTAILHNSGLAAMDFAERIQRLTALDDLTEQAKTAMDAVDALYGAFNQAFALPTRAEAEQNLQLAELKKKRAEAIEAAGDKISEREQRAIDKLDAQIEAIQRDIDVRRAQQEVDRARFDLANQMLPTEVQQKAAVEMIITAMGTASSNAATLADTLFWTSLALANWREELARWIDTVKNSPMAAAQSFQTGGVVPGPVGRPQLAVVHGGEEVVPAGVRSRRDGFTNYGTLNLYGVQNGENFVEQLERQFR